jgi:hypothetical protein
MKLKNRFKILLCNSYVVLICIVFMASIPLQLFFYLFKRKNKLGRFLEDAIFKTLFYISDVRKEI